MKVIWKFKLEVTDFQVINVPKHSKLLTVQAQMVRDERNEHSRLYEAPVMWVMVDTERDGFEGREIMMVGTGKDFSHVGEYLCTFQMHGGSLVFHVFETFAMRRPLRGDA